MRQGKFPISIPIVSLATFVLWAIPYLVVCPWDLALLRSTSLALFTTSLLFLLDLLKFRRRTFFSLCTSVPYFFLCYLELGHFVFKNGPFSVEFYQALGIGLFVLAFQSAPFWILAALAHFAICFALIVKVGRDLKAQIHSSPTRSQLWAISFLIAASLWANGYHSPLSSLYKVARLHDYLVAESVKRKVETPLVKKSSLRAQKGRNLVRLVLESLTDIFTDPVRFPGLTPNLASFKTRGIAANRMLQIPNQANSYMGHVVSNCGRSYFSQPTNAEEEVCLGDVLREAGYHGVFLRGANADSSGPFPELYSPQNGYDLFLSADDLRKKYPHSKPQGLGFPDEVLFSEGLEQYRKLRESGSPFHLTLFTLDTHAFSQPLSPSCLSNPYRGPHEQDELVQAAHCTDRLVGDFVERLLQEPGAEDLVIAIHGDHVPHKPTPAIASGPQTIYSTIFGKGVLPYQQDEPVALMDLPPTLLRVMGVQSNANFLEGRDFSRRFIAPVVSTSSNMEPPYSDEYVFSTLEMDRNWNGSFKGIPSQRFEHAGNIFFYGTLFGPIFRSHYFQIKIPRAENLPSYVAVAVDKLNPDKKDLFEPYSVLIPQPGGDNVLPLAFLTGIDSRWKSIFFFNSLADSGVLFRLDEPGVPEIVSNTTRIPANARQVQIAPTPSIASWEEIKRLSDSDFLSVDEDPKIFLRSKKWNRNRHHWVTVTLDSPTDEYARLFYKTQGEYFFPYLVSTLPTRIGIQELKFFVPKGRSDGELRLDVGERRGLYKVSNLQVWEVL